MYVYCIVSTALQYVVWRKSVARQPRPLPLHYSQTGSFAVACDFLVLENRMGLELEVDMEVFLENCSHQLKKNWFTMLESSGLTLNPLEEKFRQTGRRSQNRHSLRPITLQIAQCFTQQLTTQPSLIRSENIDFSSDPATQHYHYLEITFYVLIIA